MASLVLDQVRRSAEALPTCITLVGFLARVDFLVFNKANALSETSPTETTLVRQGHLRVFPLAFPPPLALPGLSRVRILDIFLPMGPVVPQEVGIPPEGFATHVAWIWLLPRVDSVMFKEAAALAESLPTVNTLVGPLPSVNPLVFDEV